MLEIAEDLAAINMKDARTKLIVYNEHTLGFIDPDYPHLMQPLRASVFKGAPWETFPSSKYISKMDKIRLASEKDFEDYMCVFGSFGNKNEYLFAE